MLEGLQQCSYTRFKSVSDGVVLFRFYFEVAETSNLNFFTNTTIAVVPENAGTRNLVEMLSQELPNVEFSFYQVETSDNLSQLYCPLDYLE